MSKGKILFQLSGSIACFKACQVISRLVQAGYELEVVATKSALEFVGEATLEGLTGKAVHTETFARGEYMNHIHLIRWADLAIVCPATANTICKMTSGIGDDLITTLFLAHDFEKPYLVTPTMNSQMLKHPATQSALATLWDWGVEIISGESGALACGETGEGRLAEPELILKEIESRLASRPAPAVHDVEEHSPELPVAADAVWPVEQRAPGSPSGEVGIRYRKPDRLRILVTSGGTREPIDGVRSVANTSSGRTGAAIADHLDSRGHEVTLLRAESSQPSRSPTVAEETYVTFAELDRKLQSRLSGEHFDAVIHAAAVSDFSVDSVETAGKRFAAGAVPKIDSGDELVVRLKRNRKLIDELRSQSKNKALKVIAFKLTNTGSETERKEAVEKLNLHASPDLIVHNDLSGIDSGGNSHVATLYRGRGTEGVEPWTTTDDKDALARAIEDWLAQESKGEHT